MKNSVRWLLVASLALNALLVGGVVVLSRANGWLGRPAEADANTPTIVNAASHLKAGANTTWAQMSTGVGPADLVKRLGAAGFPPEIVQAVVRGIVHREFAEKRARLWRAVPFWKPADMSALYELDAQEQRRVQAIMGPDASQAPDEIAQRERLYGSIPPAKIAQIEKLARDYDEMVEKIGREGGGNLTKKEISAFRLLREERQRDLAALLTPEELDDLEVRRSEASTAVSGMISTLDLSEAEFRAVVAAQRRFQEKLDPILAPGEITPRRFREAQDAQLAELRGLLGGDRIAKYLEATDSRYRNAAVFAREAGLSPDIAGQLWELDREGDTRAGETFHRFGDDAAARNEALAKLRDELQQRASRLLSMENWTAYRRHGGASWMNFP